MSTPSSENLNGIYRRLFRRFGPQHWWPGRTPFEIIVGAVLMQNTNWNNVEKAIANLRRERALTPRALKEMSLLKLSALIRPAGYFNVKARRLKNFIRFLFEEYGGSLARMAKEPLAVLRPKLLSVNGIGPETADSILLYAFNKPVFVIDAYTKRFLYRHNFAGHDADYHALQDVFTRALPTDRRLFNEYHALIVRLGKEFCKPRPSCESCPLKDYHYSLNARCPSCYRAGKSLRPDSLCQDCS
jgi:endonuclease-3 related protein